MKKITNNLGKQLLLIFILNFCIIVIFIGNIIPTIVKAKYESTIFDTLKEQASDLDENIKNHTNITDFFYIYRKNGIYYYSPNIFEAINPDDSSSLIEMMKKTHGRTRYQDKLFYYYKIEENDVLKISFMDGSFITRTETAIFGLALCILLLVYVGVTLIISLWSRRVVKKIEKLKTKIDNIDNPNYQMASLKGDDELKTLDLAIDDLKISLLRQEELRTQLYQNISHDFKTPLTVIKSYIEAVEDGVEDQDKALKVILEQTNKLELKVHSLLYLNKLDYLKDKDFDLSKRVDIVKIIDTSIEKFKHRNKNIIISKSFDKNSKFYGTEDIWETIIDNILNNFYRYADSKIKIAVKSNKIILYNDGPNIKEDFLDVMFIPYRKGIKGEFGLGLSIVKKSLVMIGYDIEVENHNKRGVSFIINKKD